VIKNEGDNMSLEVQLLLGIAFGLAIGTYALLLHHILKE